LQAGAPTTVGWLASCRGGALMAVLIGTTSHQPSALLNTGRGTVSPENSRLPFLRVLTGWWLRRSLSSRLVRPH